MEDFIAISGVILVAISFAAIIIWLYRPNNSKIYTEYSKIPLKEKGDRDNSIDN